MLFFLLNLRLIVSTYSDVPNNYKVLLMQGGGTAAFASVALNLLHRGEKADYILTGNVVALVWWW